MGFRAYTITTATKLQVFKSASLSLWPLNKTATTADSSAAAHLRFYCVLASDLNLVMSVRN
jgi:hypothetical protein